MELGLVAGVVLIGFVHGVLPDHGWPIAATYALNRNRRWFAGLLAASILGIGHLISSVVLVLAYFWFSAFAAFAEGPWLRYVAGTLLILLGVHEYRHGGHGMHEHDGDGAHEHDDGYGHDHDESHSHDHEHREDGDRDTPHAHHTNGGAEHAHHTNGGVDAESDHLRQHDHGHETDPGVLERLRTAVPVGGGHQHLREEHAERGLLALGTTALLLGFAHEEPIQILAICVGTEACLELMLIYSLAVIAAIIAPTLLLIAGYEHYRERIERLTPYLPTITAVVLIGMGVAFIVGLV